MSTTFEENRKKEDMNEFYNNLIGQIVRNINNMPGQPDKDYGLLIKISKGRYPYILKFIGGSSYGVNEIKDEQPLEDSVLEVQLRNLTID